MSLLLDVNLLLASAWDTHPDFKVVREWVTGLDEFYTCPITELGFLRVSIGPAFAASYEQALEFLSAIQNLPAAQRLDDNCNPAEGPVVTSYKSTTDAYLVFLATKNRLKLATLDKGILNKEWGRDQAINPLNF